MFKGVISRDNGCPWGTTGLSTATWKEIPVAWVPISFLIATQPGIMFSPLIESKEPFGGDPYPHVVVWNSNMYLEDGHHRVMKAIFAHKHAVEARIFIAKESE